MKIMLSHPMSGIPEDEVMDLRRITSLMLIGKLGADTEIIDNYHHDNAPENAGRLWHLGRSIQQMGEVDAVYFCGDYSNSKALGCLVEHIICRLYKIKILNDELGWDKKFGGS